MDSIGVGLNEPLLSADEVAALLGVPRSSVYEYARRRRNPLPSVAIGRHRRFIRADLEAWLGSQRLGRWSTGAEREQRAVRRIA